jgi:CoA:oxalate CoA-transferase
MEAILKTAPARHWLEVLERAGVPCSPINTIADAVQNPQVLSRNMLVESEGLMMSGNPIKLTGVPDPRTRPAAPTLNEHGDKIRRELER